MERPSKTPIFIDPNGRQVSFFFETSVRDRSKLLREVKDRGGLIVYEALKADILIAEGSSKEVKDFLQAWGNDKVILDAVWIYKCIQAGRYIGEDESWAGCDLRSVKLGSDANEEQREDEDQGEEQPQDAYVFIMPILDMPCLYRNQISTEKADEKCRRSTIIRETQSISPLPNITVTKDQDIRLSSTS